MGSTGWSSTTPCPSGARIHSCIFASTRSSSAFAKFSTVGVPPPVTASTRCRFQYCTDASLSPSHQISLKASVCGTKSSAQIAAMAPTRR